jgi:FkbM family methyltransferase
MNNAILQLANKLYKHCYPAYYPLYAAWKALSDRRERALLRQWIRPGMTVVDVGANIGIYASFFSKLVESSGCVYAFEPDSANYQRLIENAESLDNVSPNHAAVGATTGTIRLFVSDKLNVDHRTFDSGDGRRGVEVPVVSLDDYFAAGQRVDFIKIDVQGFELSVLQGAERLLVENRDIKVLLEYWPYGLTKAGVTPSMVIEQIRSLGFEVSTIGDRDEAFTGSALDANNVDHYCNLFASRLP